MGINGEADRWINRWVCLNMRINEIKEQPTEGSLYSNEQGPVGSQSLYISRPFLERFANPAFLRHPGLWEASEFTVLQSTSRAGRAEEKGSHLVPK